MVSGGIQFFLMARGKVKTRVFHENSGENDVNRYAPLKIYNPVKININEF